MTKDEKWLLEEKYNGVETEEFQTDKARLAFGEPVAYLIGFQPFLGLKIYLDSHPLIPRSETEWWTEQLLLRVETYYHLEASLPSEHQLGSEASKLMFLDLCAGSGAIGCAALAKLPNAQIYFGEIDPAHKATISRNIHENNLDTSRATVRIGDLFEPFENMQFDIIATNPPYIPVNRELPASVADYEPSQALYAGKDGLDVIRRIARELPKHLRKDGVAWIEVDSAHVAATCAIFTHQGLSAEICNDQYGKPRVLVCRHTWARSAQ